jgi:enoyl-CoA hydratase/carnithine racemase
MTDAIRSERSGGVQIVRLNRPEKKNALTSAMYAALADALEAGERDEAMRVHLIAGAPGAFSAGNDIGDFLAFAEAGELGAPILRFLRTVAGLDKPLVAAVDGLAIGIGTTLLLHCDLVYCTPGSTFRTPFLDLGLVPEAASSLLAPRLMGHARAFELLCLGAPFDAERALAAGLVNAVVDADRVEDAARDAAEALANKPVEALRAARRLLKREPQEVLHRIDEEAALFSERLRSKEAQAAFAAFMDRKGGKG